MQKILFLCQHGGAKSVVAASHFNRLAAERDLPFVASAAAAEDPYDAVPRPVADYLQAEGVDVRSLEPHHVTPVEIDTATRVITIGCSLSDSERPALISDRWDDVPAASDDLDASVAAIRRHVEELAGELDGDR